MGDKTENRSQLAYQTWEPKGDGTIRTHFDPPILAKTKFICKDKNSMVLDS